MAARFIAGTLLLGLVGGLAGALTGSPTIAIAAIVLAVVAWNRADLLLLTVVALAPILRAVKAETFPPELIAQAKILAILVMGVVLLTRGAVNQSRWEIPRPFLVLLTAWAAVTGLSVLHAVNPNLSLFYIPITLCGLIAFIAAFHLDQTTQKRLLAVIFGMGAAIGLIVALQYVIVTYGVFTFLSRFIIEPRTQAYYASNPLSTMGAQYRPSGTMFHPNSMGLYFAVLLPFACALSFSKGLPKLSRRLVQVCTVMLVIGLLATNSRGATVAALVALAYLSWHVGFRSLIGMATAAGVAGLGYFALAGGEQLWKGFERLARIEGGLSGRATVWQNSWEIIRQQPFFGVGPANFTTEYVSRFGFFIPNSVAEQEGQIWAIQNLQPHKLIENYHAHNMYFLFAGELGFMGPVLFLALAFWLIRHSERIAKAWPTDAPERALALGAASLAVGLLFYGLFDSQFAFTIDSISLLLAPLLAISLRRAEPRKQVTA